MKIPFNKPCVTGKEVEYIQQVLNNNHISGNGEFTEKCHKFISAQIGSNRALLTHSCTAALEMAAMLADLKPGDEVIMPSYTFVSTANAFVLRGAIPVFVDIRPDTLNMDETKIEAAITPKTKAIVPVHYAGVGCEMDVILAIAGKYNLLVIEDAAQAFMSTYKGKALGGFGCLATVSFHETKNIISGEGGVLLINHDRFIERAEIIWEKGTNRSQFFRGQVDKYTWIDLGSSHLPSEIIAAFLFAQLEEAEFITKTRLRIWSYYHSALEDLEYAGIIRRPIIPEYCQHNAHMYYILLPDLKTRIELIKYLRELDILAVFHYIPLHSSPAGMKYGCSRDELIFTTNLSERILRLPLFLSISDSELQEVIDAIYKFFK